MKWPSRNERVRAMRQRLETQGWPRLQMSLLVALAGIAVAGAVGTEIHDSERRADAMLARTRQTVSATVLEVGTVANFDGSEMPVVRAQWTAGGAPHTDTFQWSGTVRPGDRIQIWVDNHGDHTRSPAPLSSTVVRG